MAWELRAQWAKAQPVMLRLSERCEVERIEGYISHVGVTGAFVVVDDWHVPMEDVLSVTKWKGK